VKKNYIKKLPTEKDILQMLKRGEISLPPLSFRLLEDIPSSKSIEAFDAFLKATWGTNTVKFAVQCKSISTPKAFQFSLYWFKVASTQEDVQSLFIPLIIFPYLNESQLKELEKENCNGIDLCGNGYISVPGKFSVFRSGQKNRFSSSAPIKNVYRNNSSMVARTFLSKSRCESVNSVFTEVNAKNLLVKKWAEQPMSLSTVSKVLSNLEEDLIISRKENIRLLQLDKLLEKLSDNYTPPEITNRIRLKAPTDILEFLSKQSKELKVPIISTGIAAVKKYAVMQRSEVFTVYCPNIESLLKSPLVDQNDKFPNLELLETKDETVYFDSRFIDDFYWASPVQSYLELMAGDKRDKETADQIQLFIKEELGVINQ
jgi:hypothetical protein